MNTYDQILKSAEFIQDRFSPVPEVGVILGSGLGEFADTMEDRVKIKFHEIPGFKKVRVHGHEGNLVLGKMQGRISVVLQGRYHYYEGYPMADVVFPVRVLCKLGIQTLLITNAAGGIDPSFQPGDFMIIRDHINMMGANPLRGENDDRLGPRFPDLSEAYDPGLVSILSDALRSLGREPREGVYAGLFGPSYETPAEIRMLSILGADAVGMSTVPETIAARHMGVKVGGISCITNMASGISKHVQDHKDVTETAGRVKETFIALLKKVIPQV